MHGLFYKISLATSLKINEDYTITTDDDETFFEPSAYFINNSVGYQFDERSSLALNMEYNWHGVQRLNFFPAYLSFRYNLLADDDGIFLRGGYGTLLKAGKNFETGNMYKLGLGYQFFDNSFRNSWLVGIDFNRKRFGHRALEGLSSVSFFFEFQVF